MKRQFSAWLALGGLLVALASGCGDRGDGLTADPSSREGQALADSLLSDALLVLRRNPPSEYASAVGREGLRAGVPLAHYAFRKRGKAGDVWDSLSKRAIQYLVPVCSQGTVVATYLVDCRSGRVQQVGWGEGVYNDTARAIAFVRQSAEEGSSVKVVVGGWSAAVSHKSAGDIAVVFFNPRFGGGSLDGPNAESRMEIMRSIRSGELYKGAEAERLVRAVFALSE